MARGLLLMWVMNQSPTIRDFMHSPVYTIGEQQNLSEAAKRMREHSCRHLPVLDGGIVRGILSDRDIDLVAGLPGASVSDVTVADAMVTDPYAVDGRTPLAQAMREMANHKYGAALVMEDRRVVGIFTTVNALAAFATMLEGQGSAAS